MGAETMALVAEWWAGATAAAEGATAGTAVTSASVSSAGAELTAAQVASSATAGSGLGQAVATAAGTVAAQSVLAPDRPDLPKPLAMPDPLAQEAARQKQIAESTTRRGRASTILTQSGGQTLGN